MKGVEMVWVAFGVGLFVGYFLGILTLGLYRMIKERARNERIRPSKNVEV